LVAIAGLLLLGMLFVALGVWQLQRAAQSRATRERFAEAAEQSSLADLPADLGGEALRFRRVQVRGSYAPERQFLLDNMVHDGVVGYQVLTPFRPRGEDRWLLVNRGWLRAGPDRSVLPDVRIGSAERTLSGRIERLPRPGLRLDAAPADFTAASLAVLSYPTAAELAASLRQPLFDYQVLLDATEADGYLRAWVAPGVGPERNIVYAGQWLLLGGGAVAAAVVIAAKSARRRS
jgi:surfeit locus 1 family protein